MKFLHISDIHFPTTNWNYIRDEYLNAFLQLIDEIHDPQLSLVISGDITTKGNARGYVEAAGFFNEIISQHKLPRERILLCPGNHDIEPSPPYFKEFDAFCYSLRKDHIFQFNKKTNFVYEMDDCFFLIVNSAFRYDHKYGSVDIDGIKSTLSKSSISQEKTKIAIVHHHFLGQFEDDISTIRNAYPFLKLLEDYQFNCILHGHQHTMMNIQIGNSGIQTIGVRTPTSATRGYVSGVNVYEVSGKKLQVDCYIFSRDLGGFKLIHN